MAVFARTLCVSLFVLLCLAHTALSLAIPADGRFRDPTPSSPTSDVSVTTLEARNLAGETTLVQRATVSPGGNGGNHGLVVRGETPKDTPSIRLLARVAVIVKRSIYDWPELWRYCIMAKKEDPKSKIPTVIGTKKKEANSKDPTATGTVHPLLRPHKTPLNYAALREQMLKDDVKPRRTSQSPRPPPGRTV